MRFGIGAIEESGIIPEHATAMAKVATKTNTLIMIRAPGEYATRLITEGYSAKSYHIKAKSCNFGPMAGFILEKAEFSKRAISGATDAQVRRNVRTQTQHIADATTHGAETIHLTIPKRHKEYLFNKKYVKACAKTGNDVIIVPHNPRPTIIKCTATFKGTGVDEQNSPQRNYTYFLLENQNDSYSLYYRYLIGNPLPPIRPVMAIVDPHWNLNWRNNNDNTNADPTALPPGAGNYYVNGLRAEQEYMKATCADYDLFTCWEHNEHKTRHFNTVDQALYNRSFERPLRENVLPDTPANNQNNIQNYIRNNEHPHFGNISPLIYNMLRYLNTEFLRCGNRRNRQPMVQHSDECGRPGIDDIDFPVFMAFPDTNKVYNRQLYDRHSYILLENIDDFADLIQEVNRTNEFRINLHPEWTRKLRARFANRRQQYANRYYYANRHYNQIIGIANTYRII